MFDMTTYWPDWPEFKSKLLRAWKAWKTEPEMSLAVQEDSLSYVQKAIREIEFRIRTDSDLKKLGFEFVGEDDRVFVRELKGIRCHWIAHGGHIEASTIRQEILELPRDQVGFHVYEFEDKLRAHPEKWGELVDLAVARVKIEIMQRVFGLLGAAVPTASPYYLGPYTNELNRGKAADYAVNEVLDETPYGDDVLAIGRRRALARMGGLTAVHRNGRIELRRWLDDQTGEDLFPEDTMFVATPGAFKFAIWGSPSYKEYKDDAWYQHLIMRWDVGGVIHHPERTRRLSTTPVAPPSKSDQSEFDVPNGGIGGDLHDVAE